MRAFSQRSTPLSSDTPANHGECVVCTSVFDWLPLAACIEDQILCLHGGPGASVVRGKIALCDSTLLRV